MSSKWSKWVVDRFAFKPIQEQVLERRVAKGAWYSGDGAALMFLLGILVLTGAFMTLTYTPSPDAAYESVRHITEEQTMGWFVRAVHYWSAGVMVVFLVFHLLRQILIGGYKSPREGTWLIGVLLFFAVITMSFTGYVLRWDERSIYALRVALHMFHNVPVIGNELVLLIQGGRELGALTVPRIYAVHVIFLPLLILLLVGYHLYLVLFHGVTSPTERSGRPIRSAEEQRQIYEEDKKSDRRGEVFYPVTMVKSGAMAAFAFVVVLFLALVFGPAELYPEANLHEISFPVEEWWFWWYSALIALLPPAIAPAFYILFPLVLFLILVLLPFVDRGARRGIKGRPAAIAAVALIVIALLYLTDLRRQSSWTGWPLEEPPPVPGGVELSLSAEQGRLLFARYGCTTCHPVAGYGREVAIDLASLPQPRSLDEIREYVLNPPEGIAMPAYEEPLREGRITEEEFARIIEYVHVAQTFPRTR